MDTAEEVETRTGTRPSARLVWVVGIVGGCWILTHAVGLLDGKGDYTLIVAAVIAVVATVVGLARHRPQPLWPWLSIAAALGLFLVADVLRLALGTLGDLSSSRSLLPDALALPAFALLAIGVAGVAGIRRRNPDDIDAIFDAVIVALSVLVLAWVYIVTPSLTKQSVGTTLELILAAYPVASVFVFAIGCRLVFSKGRQTAPAMWFCLAAIFCLLVGDVVYALLDADLIQVSGRLADIPYTLAFLSYSMAILHPTMRRVGQHRKSDEAAPTRGRLITVALALFVPALVLLSGPSTSTTADRVALGVIVVLLIGAASWRMSRALRQHASSQTRLAYQATHDSLTGLPNRSFIAEHIDRMLSEQGESLGSVALLHIDIDRFKLVNDTMGHNVGDDLLIAVSERLRERVRPGDIVGRLGGDEFVVVVGGLADEATATEFGERARLSFKEPFSVRGNDITVTASVGIAFHEARVGDVAALIRDADTAVNHAKSRGGDDVATFDTSMRERVAERLHLERELRTALANDELFLHFQPKLRLSDRKVVGLEALLRWQHPELGIVRPDMFIAIAEDTGMIVEIGAWVIDKACAELARLRESFRGTSELCMSVNVSARQLRSDTLMDTIAQALLRHRVPPECLCLELTESILMENLELVSGQLDAIRDCGTRISIDDFGTGYSSLAYLSKLPVDELKIDRSFIKELGVDQSAASLIQAVVFIASSLGITSVAEGVETPTQAKLVAELGCAEVQGFLFSRPLPPRELDLKLIELGLAPANHLRAVPTAEHSSLGSTA